MTTNNKHPDGHFCWNQIATHNVDRAIEFYSALFGWEIVDEELGHGDEMVRLLHDGEFVVGIHQVNADDPPRWEPHLSVSELSSFLEMVKEQGGYIEEEPLSAAPYGTMAEIAGPSGTRLCLWSADDFGGHSPQPKTGVPRWYELQLIEDGPERDFWPSILNWTKTSEDGGKPQYQAADGTSVARIQIIEADNGIVLNDPRWITFIQVDDVGAICADAAAIDATILAKPYDVENVGRCAIISDPQGTVFGVIQIP